jgi:Cys-tRNA(Pro)/Cys-tRNA(Cys) deacylase
MTKTNAARILDKQGIHYELISYEVDENDLSATTVATKVGQDINTILYLEVIRPALL